MSLLPHWFVIESCCCRLSLRFMRLVWPLMTKTFTLNPLEVINTDVNYSGFDLLATQLGDLIGLFFIQFGRKVILRISLIFVVL